MKKILFTIVVLIICFTFLLPLTVTAANASATLAGPNAVRAGDTITLTFHLNGTGLYGASGTLNYDSSQLTLTGTQKKIGNGWEVEFNGNTFVAIDNNMATPINSNTALFTATFKVNSNLSVGAVINISCTDVTGSDGKADAKIGTVTYSRTIAAPLSKDNALKSLTVSNATISPAFSSNTTSYTAEVPFDVSKLNVSATANDSKAKVSINSPNLRPGGTTDVTVTVTAENGSAKTYTITVKRAQDPNYVASSNNDLSGITVDGFLLSPLFTANNTRYVIWLPYETDSVTVSGTASDSKASVTVEGGSGLKAGVDNEIKVICTAEDGTQKIYTVIAKRAAAHDGSTEPTDPPTEPSQPDSQPEPEPTEDTAASGTPQNSENSNGISPWWLPAAAVVGILIGFVGGCSCRKPRRRR